MLWGFTIFFSVFTVALVSSVVFLIVLVSSVVFLIALVSCVVFPIALVSSVIYSLFFLGVEDIVSLQYLMGTFLYPVQPPRT